MKNKILQTTGIITIFIMLISLTTAYYTNTNKFFEDSRKNDGHQGLALKRESNEFIIDGSGTGTILDTVTGLTWDKNLNHKGSTLKWKTTNSAGEPTFNFTTKVYSYPTTKADYPAFSYCEDLVLGKYDDYRLPSRNELMTLINEMEGNQLTCSTLESLGFTNCQNTNYWTKNEYKPSTSDAWYVRFLNGGDSADAKANGFSVVCVRRD